MGGPVVRLDGGTQGSRCVEEAGLHRPDREFESASDLRLAPSQVVMEDDDRPLFGRKSAEAAVQAITDQIMSKLK